MPKKTFLNGYPLPASDLNTYLMDQAVQTYASATARTTALPTPVEGQITYLEDTNIAYVWDGSSWNALVDAKNYGTVLPTRRNAIINGAMDWWQRGASFTTPNGVSAYTADRWAVYVSGATGSVSQQAFTPGSAPAAGYEATNFLRVTKTGSGYMVIANRIEDVRTFAGQTVTLSFWAKISSGTYSVTPYLRQNFGSGGSASVDIPMTGYTVTTSWQRFSISYTLPSISGKTIGTGSYLEVDPIFNDIGTGITYDLWGVQLESGSVATPFSRAGGTLQGELAACQRYYETSRSIWGGNATSGATYFLGVNLLTAMRAAPTMTFSSSGVYGFASGAPNFNSSRVNDFFVSNQANSTVNGGYFDFTWTASSEL